MRRMTKKRGAGWWVGLLMAWGQAGGAEEGFRGMVASATPEGTAAGLAIFALGGNAADAAVATAFALAVTEPAMTGLAAGTQVLLHAPGARPVMLNGTSFSPAGMPPEAKAEDLRGYRAATVPSMVKMQAYLWRNYGSGNISWEQLLAPAIRYAEEGFEVGPFRHKVWVRHEEDLRKQPAAAALFLRADGTVPAEGDRFRQPQLAATLRRLAAAGAEDFYRGEIAREIAADMAANGGWITAADLAQFPDPLVQTPVHGTYRGHDLYSATPPAGGWVVALALNLLERQSPEALAPWSFGRIPAVAAALRAAHGLRDRSPIPDLSQYEGYVAERTSKSFARDLEAAEGYWVAPETVGWRGEGEGREPQASGFRWEDQDRGEEAAGGETTHFSVVGPDGTAVAVTTSINTYFGAWVAHPRLGILYNDYAREFRHSMAGHPHAVGPGRMPYSSMSPTVVAQGGRPVLVLGSPGSQRIISAVTQVAQLWIDTELSITEAVAAPRVHVVPPNRLYLESKDVPAVVRRELGRMGFNEVQVREDIAMGPVNAYWGGVHAIAWENGRWVGAADPRRDGMAGALAEAEK